MTEVNGFKGSGNYYITPDNQIKQKMEKPGQTFEMEKTTTSISQKYLPGGGYAYPNMPISMDRRLITPTNNKPKVMVYDDFDNKTDFDRDDKLDESHGFYVESHINNADVAKKSINNTILRPYSFGNLTDEYGNKINAVNASVGQTWGYEDINYLVENYKSSYNPSSDIPYITPENLKENAPKVRKAIEDIVSRPENKENIDKYKKEYLELVSKLDKTKPGSEESNKLVAQMLDIRRNKCNLLELSFMADSWNEVDRLAKQGVPVVIAAGNVLDEFDDNGQYTGKPDNIINMYAIGSENAIVVGSADTNLSVHNSSIDIYAPPSGGDIAKQLPTLSRVKDIVSDNSIPMQQQKFNAIKQSILPGFIMSSGVTSFTTPEVTDKIVAPLSQKGYSVQQIKRIVQQSGKMIEGDPNLSLQDAANKVIILNNYVPEGRKQ